MLRVSATEPVPEQLTGIRLNAHSLKLLAHPLRSRLLIQLRTTGPATATQLAGVLGTNSGATSYHLRKLESVGLVADTGDGSGKQRLWRAATDYHSFYASDFPGDEDSQTALNWLEHDYLRHFAEQAERWIDAAKAWPLSWQDATGSGDVMVEMTVEELQALHDELDEVIERHRRNAHRTPHARRVAIYVQSFPLEMDEVPEP